MKKITINKKTNEKKKSPIRITIDILGYVIFSIVFILILVVAIQAFKGQQPSLFGYCYYYIETDSMNGEQKDSFSSKTVIISKNINEKECYSLKVGDIITFTPTDLNLPSYVTTKTHRIVEIDYDKKSIVTKGDANDLNDSEISFSNVKSKYVGKSRFLTELYRLVKSVYGFLILIFIPILALIIAQIYSLVLSFKKEKIKEETESIEKDYNLSLEEKKKNLEKEAIKEYLDKMNEKK